MVVSFEQRKEQIFSIADIDVQLFRAKKYVMNYRAKAKKASSLAEKLEFNEKQKEAERVLRQLRLSVFDIEDEIITKKETTV